MIIYFEQLGIHDEVQKNFRSLCCFKLGSLSTVFRVPTSGYVPGQLIVTVIDYKNLSSGIQIAKISAKLERVSETVKIFSGE